MQQKRIKSGDVFGRLMVLSSHMGKHHTNLYCICECGNTTVVDQCNLGKGTKSCGCLNKEVRGKGSITHGKTNSPEYSSYSSMVTRCTNKNRNTKENYIDRGIVICKRWKKFENFYKDMGPRPKGTTLDRIDNNKGYYPANCRWATHREQQQNKRSNRYITAFGKTQAVVEWSRETGISQFTLYYRMNIGLTGEAVFKSIRNRKK